jgi:signal transduction histidine kinase
MILASRMNFTTQNHQIFFAGFSEYRCHELRNPITAARDGNEKMVSME